MFSLKNLLRKDDQLLTLLEDSALQARTSVQALIASCQNSDANSAVQDIAYSRIKDRKITKEISDRVYSTFIATLDCEDIERLSSVLYKIPKIADKFSERLGFSREIIRGVEFSSQLSLLLQATEALYDLVRSLQDGLNLPLVKELTDKLQQIENQADMQMLSLYRELYSGKYKAVQVVILKDLYELLEKAIDRCRTAGNVIARITLKNT